LKNCIYSPMTLRRRMLVFILPAAALVVAGISAWYYLDARRTALKDYEMLRSNSEGDIVQAILVMDGGFRMLENRLEAEMEPHVPMLLRAFDAAGRQPERMDLAALKRRMGQNLDIYIIDGQVVIRWTTDTSARNFDFHAFGLADTMRRIRLGDRIAHERVRTNVASGQLGDWIYVPTPDHRYIIEIGYGASEALTRLATALNPLKVAKRLEQTSPLIESVGIYDVFGYAFGHKGEMNYGPEAAFQQIIRKVVSRRRLEIRNGTTLDVYRYVDLASLKPSVSNPSKIVRIRYTLAPVRAELHRIAAFGLASIIIAVLALAVTVSGLASWLTRPLRTLHGVARAVSSGDHSQRAMFVPTTRLVCWPAHLTRCWTGSVITNRSWNGSWKSARLSCTPQRKSGCIWSALRWKVNTGKVWGRLLPGWRISSTTSWLPS